MRLAQLVFFLLLAVPASACATHVPPNQLAQKRYLELAWQPDLEAGRAEARAQDKPLLVMLVSGQLDGLC